MWANSPSFGKCGETDEVQFPTSASVRMTMKPTPLLLVLKLPESLREQNWWRHTLTEPSPLCST